MAIQRLNKSNLLRFIFGGGILVTTFFLLLTVPVFSPTRPTTEIRVSNAPVFSQETGGPVPNAEVSFYIGFKCVGNTRTNPDGRYSIRIRRSCTDMPTMMVINCDGYHPTTNSPIRSFASFLVPKTNSCGQAVSKAAAIRERIHSILPTNCLPDALDTKTVERSSSRKRWQETIRTRSEGLFETVSDEAAEKNATANELFSLPELPDGVVDDLSRMFRSEDENEVWRDYCLQFLGSALERTDGVTDEDRALARETLVGTLASTNAIFAGTALRSLHRGDPSDPLVASNALRIARDPSYPSSSRITALLILEDCVRSTSSTPSTLSTLAETASAVSADPSASSLLRQTAEAVLERNAH